MEQNEQIYSEDVQDIIGQTPSNLSSYSLFGILLLLVTAFGVSWFVKSPDTISASIKIFPDVPRIKLISRATGKIVFFFPDNSKAKKGDWLGIIENTANLNDILYIKDLINIVEKNPSNIIKTIDSLKLNKSLKLGTLNEQYVKLLKAEREYNFTLNLFLRNDDRKILTDKITNYIELQKEYTHQKEIITKLHNNSKVKFEVNKDLNVEKFVSKLELNSIEDELFSTELKLVLVNESIISNKALISSFQIELNRLTNDQREKLNLLKSEYLDAYNLFVSSFNTWKNTYVFESLINGKVSYVQHWANNQFVNLGDEVLAIIPEKFGIEGIASLPQDNSGEVKTGLTVNVSLASYPNIEYGFITGKIKEISPIPKDGNYRVTVEFSPNLKTSQGYKISYKHDLEGIAEINIKEQRLIEKLFNKIMDSFSKKKLKKNLSNNE